ncbi:MAG: glycosyl hydrolase 53 family protein [Saprospiraceae bacterium]|nr:glycosyl hydrolase 53 family protein [Saprospiraceae bacterium]
MLFLSKTTSLGLFLLTLALFFTSASCKKTTGGGTVTPTSDTRTFYTADKFVMGGDLSYVNQIQDYGGVFKDSSKVKDPFLLCKDRGMNLVRVRLWHTPAWTATINNGKMYSDLVDVAKTIKRAKDAGMTVNLDLHYSDTWADPQKQDIPKAWEGLPLSILKDSVYNYTLSVLNYLKARNLTPEMIQIGNENNNGMCWNVGKIVSNNFQPFADLLKSGIKAVRDFSTNSTIKPQVVIHVAQLQTAEWWADGVINKGGVTDYDILGLSHYYQWSTMNNMADISTVIKNLKTKYGKKVMIVETAYSWTNQNGDTYNNIMSDPSKVPTYPLTSEGQYNYMKDLTQTVISAGGSGIQYWEPLWITSPMKDLWGTGSSWENNALFDFQGNALKGFDFMTFAYKF